MARTKSIFSEKKLSIALRRMAYEIIERHRNFNDTVLIGIQPRGIHFAKRIHQILQEIDPTYQIQYGTLDITFYRDDFKKSSDIFIPEDTDMNFSIENKKVILIDDVLYTGRTIRAAMEAIVDYGRPSLIELMVLIDRRFSREVPIQADYVGLHVDAVDTQKVRVLWEEKDGENGVVMV